MRDLRNVPQLREPLQYSYDHAKEQMMEERELLMPSAQKRKRRVGFEETVTVVP